MNQRSNLLAACDRRALAHLSWTVAALGAISCSSVEIQGDDDDDVRIQTTLVGPADYEDTIDQTVFVQVAQQVIDLYQPAATAHHAATFVLQPNFQNNVSTFASRLQVPRRWVMEPRGRLLNPRLTRDVARFITCHEVGHFFGGFPFGFHPAVSSIADTATVLSSEGTADYFATRDCLRRVWAGDPNNAAFAELVTQETGSTTARERCDDVWAAQPARDICYRSIAVAHRAVAWLDNQGFNAQIDNPDPTQVLITLVGHFGLQCRFDTMVAGALCDAASDQAVIPGLVPSAMTGLYGDHSEASEAAATPYACHGSSLGARPRCWFKPAMPEWADCGDVTEGGECDGDDVLVCHRNYGVLRTACPEGQTCVMLEEIFPECQ